MSQERNHALADVTDDGLADVKDDGRYDALIISAESRDDGVSLSCVITTGPSRGDVVDIVSPTFAARDPLDLMGLPCTLVVQGNEIRIEP